MAKLRTERFLDEHDGFYARLLAAHRDLAPDESHALNARLVLILANHVGDAEVLDEALALAGVSPTDGTG